MRSLKVRRSALTQFFGPSALYAVACGAMAVLMSSGSIWMPLLFIVGAAVVLWTWHSVRWTDQWQRWLSFGAILLLMCALNRGFALADYFVNALQYDQWPFFTQYPQRAVFKGEVITLVGTLLTVLAWRMCGGMRISPALIVARPSKTFRVMLVIYVLALVGMVLAAALPKVASASGQLLPTLLGLGLVATFLLPLPRFHNGRIRLIAVVILSIPFLLLAAKSGMKGNIILAIIPAAVMAWRTFRHPAWRAAMVAGGFVTLALVTSYVQLYRAEVWKPASIGMPISHTVPTDFLHEIQKTGLPKTLGGGLADFIERANGTYRHGWAVAIADEQAMHPKMVLAPLSYVFIPRILWPGKPENFQGSAYTSLVTGTRFVARRSSTAAGFYTGLYLGYGWPAFLLGALLAGVLLAVATRVALRLGGSLCAGMYIFSMLPFMLRMSESWPVDVLAKPVIGVVYVLVVVTAARLVARITIRTRHKQSTPA